MQEREKQSNHFNPNHLIPMGLFKDGIHFDTEINAKTTEGENVSLKVNYVHTSSGGTLFVPELGQTDALRKLFPPKRHNI